MKQIILFVLVIFVFPEIAFSQIELNSAGRVGIGGAPIVSTNTMRVDGTSDNSIYVINDNDPSAGTYRGILTYSYGGNGSSTGKNNYGIASYAYDAKNNNAIYGYAVKSNDTETGRGIYAKVDQADTGDNSYAGYFDVVGTGAGTSYAGWFVGDVVVTGDCCDAPSDEKLKENIQTLDGATFVDRLMQLRPISYRFKETSELSPLKLSTGIQYGFTAQEVETVFPEFINDHVYPGETDIDGIPVGEPISFKGINYTKLIPLFVSAIQEQQAEIDALKNALSANGIEVNR